MRVCCVLLLAVATLVAGGAASSIEAESKISRPDVPVHSLVADSKRYLRVDNKADEYNEASEERAVPVLGKLTSYFNQKTLDLWLYLGKEPKEVWKILKLNGLKGRVVKNWKHKYYVRYINMWKKAGKNTGTA